MLDAVLLDVQYLATRSNAITFAVHSQYPTMRLYVNSMATAHPACAQFIYLAIIGSFARMNHDLQLNQALPATIYLPFAVTGLATFPSPLLANITWQQIPVGVYADVPISHLTTPLTTCDATLQALLVAQCHADMPLTTALSKTTAMVKQLLQTQLAHTPKLAMLAEQLNLSERTLKRHLQLEGTSYRQLLIEIKQLTAIQLLQTTDLPIDDIAYRIGYASPTTFKNQIKQWTGKTPRAIRQEAPRLKSAL